MRNTSSHVAIESNSREAAAHEQLIEQMIKAVEYFPPPLGSLKAIQLLAVHTSEDLIILLDMLLDRQLLVNCKRRRQGKRGLNSARNHMLRKALWYAREALRQHDPSKWRNFLLTGKYSGA